MRKLNPCVKCGKGAHMNGQTPIAKAKGQFGRGRPPATPRPCSRCGKVSVRQRRGLCNSCYTMMLHRKHQAEKPQKPAPTIPGLTEIQNYVWNHKDTLTIRQICERMRCTPLDVRGALEAGLIALHKPKTYAMRGTWHL